MRTFLATFTWFDLSEAVTWLTVAIVVYLNLRYVLPGLWRECRQRPSNVVDLAERRRQLAAAAHPDRRVS